MAIIRDQHCGGILMIPLLHQWGVRRCNIEGCREKPNTIITGPDAGEAEIYGLSEIYGLCNDHWHELSDTPGEVSITLEFDDFDAFKEPEVADD
jgi:hypothetical protein